MSSDSERIYSLVVICSAHVLANAARWGYTCFPLGGVLRTTHFPRRRPIRPLGPVVESHLPSGFEASISPNVGRSELLRRDKNVLIITIISLLRGAFYSSWGRFLHFLPFAARDRLAGNLESAEGSLSDAWGYFLEGSCSR